MEQASLIYVTVPNDDLARSLADKVVSLRLAACANILPGIKSVYWWQENLCQADEVIVIFKTRVELCPALINEIQANHPYQTPAIVAVPITNGSPDFIRWINAETKSPDGQKT